MASVSKFLDFLPVSGVRGFQAFGMYWLYHPEMRPRVICPDNRGELMMVPSGLLQPVAAPTASADNYAQGTMDTGDHYVYTTFYRSLDGSESPLSPMATVAVPDATSIITLSSTAAPRDPLVDYRKFYVQSPALGGAYNITSLTIPITTASCTFSGSGSDLNVGLPATPNQNFHWPAVANLTQYGNRLAGAGQVDWSPSWAVVTIDKDNNEVAFAGAARAKVTLDSFSAGTGFPEHLWWKDLYVQGKFIGTVFYIESPQVLYLYSTAPEDLTKVRAEFVGHHSRLWMSSYESLGISSAPTVKPYSTSPFFEYFEGSFDADDGEDVTTLDMDGNRLFVFKDTKVFNFSGGQVPGAPETDYPPERSTLTTGVIAPGTICQGPAGSKLYLSQHGVCQFSQGISENLSELVKSRQLFYDFVKQGELGQCRALYDYSTGYYLFYLVPAAASEEMVMLAYVPETQIPNPSFVKFRGPAVSALCNLQKDNGQWILLYGDTSLDVGQFLKRDEYYDKGVPFVCRWRSGIIRADSMQQIAVTEIRGLFQSEQGRYALTARFYGMEDWSDIESLPSTYYEVSLTDQNKRDWQGVPYDLGANHGVVMELLGFSQNLPTKIGTVILDIGELGD